MKKAIMEKWTETLASGRHRQVTGSLKAPKGSKAYGYCCLGVLCDIYAKETGKGAWVDAEHGGKGFRVGHITREGTLPEAVQKWAGLKTNGGASGKVLLEQDTREYTSLVELNDEAGLKFKDIAKIIKKNYKNL